MLVPESAAKITEQPKVYQNKDTDTGNTVQRAFCTNFGSPIYSAETTMPGLYVVKLGLFDEIPKPSLEIYCKSKPSWEKSVDGTNRFEGMPTQ